jgi:hypothetical protein
METDGSEYAKCISNGNTAALCIDAGTMTHADAHAVALASVNESKAIVTAIPLLLLMLAATVARYWLNAARAK